MQTFESWSEWWNAMGRWTTTIGKWESKSAIAVLDPSYSSCSNQSGASTMPRECTRRCGEQNDAADRSLRRSVFSSASWGIRRGGRGRTDRSILCVGIIFSFDWRDVFEPCLFIFGPFGPRKLCTTPVSLLQHPQRHILDTTIGLCCKAHRKPLRFLHPQTLFCLIW